MPSSAAQASLPPFPNHEYLLMVINGDDRGATYRLSAAEVRIGRDPQNHVAFPTDPKCSRFHAIIRLGSSTIEIENISDGNKVYVNGKSVSRATITDGTKIQIGQTQLVFKLSIASPLTVVPSRTASPFPSAFPEGSYRSSSSRSNSNSSNKTRFYIIIGGIGLLFVWLLSDSGAKKKEEVAIRSDEQVEADIEAARRLREDLNRRRAKAESAEAIEAESAYLKGFRDYRLGQYQRASQSFQAALSLNPNHSLAKRYLVLSQRRADEVVQHHMIEGRRFRDQYQFAYCKASFQKVMTLLADPNNRTYKEAKELFDICETLLRSQTP